MGLGSTAGDKAARRASDAEAGGSSGAGGASDPNNSGIIRAVCSLSISVLNLLLRCVDQELIFMSIPLPPTINQSTHSHLRTLGLISFISATNAVFGK